MTFVTDLPVWEDCPFLDQVPKPYQIYRKGNLAAIVVVPDDGAVVRHAAFNLPVTARDIATMIATMEVSAKYSGTSPAEKDARVRASMRAQGYPDQFHPRGR